MNKKHLIEFFAITAIITAQSLASARPAAQVAKPKSPAAAQETDDQAKIDRYKRFTENRTSNPRAAYEAAREYLQKYDKDKDQYVDYLRKWVALYEKEERRLRLPQLVYNEKKYEEGFAVGKQILAEEPDYLKALIDLGCAGYLASIDKNETFNSESLAYARRATQLIESGKAPETWAPFKGRDDALAQLYNAIAFFNLKAAPNEAIEPLIKVAQLDSDLKKAPSTYYFLARAYETGPYAKMSADYQKNFEGKPETTESKQALDKLNEIIDRTIDAYARAVAAAGSDPKNAQNKATWFGRLTVLYKFRHNDSDAGLNELVATAMNKPLSPKP